MSNVEDRTAAQAEVAAYYADPVQRLAFMRALFNRSARHYDLVNLLVSLGSGAWYRRFCLRRAGVRPGMQLVDIATGTGLLAREAVALTRDPACVTGIDVSEAMLAIAQRNLNIGLIQATAEALPLADASTDFVSMGYALRHVADLPAAFAEALRILRPGGTMLLLEVSAPRNRILRAIAYGFIGKLIPRLSQFFARDEKARLLMQYHWQTILSYMPPDVVMSVMRDCGFAGVTCTSYLDLFHYYIGKRPDMEPR